MQHAGDASPVDADIEVVLFSHEQIAERIQSLGREIAKEYQYRRPVLLAALSGAFMFLAGVGQDKKNLTRSMQPTPPGLHIDFVRAISYTGTSTAKSASSEVVAMQKIDVTGRDVLLVEDIVDTGKTALKLRDYLLKGGAKSVKLACLLDKSERRTCDIHPDYCCFHCPDKFVVGYGLDYNEEYRSLPYVGVLRPELYR